MALGNAVADGNGIKLERIAACGQDSFFYPGSYLSEVHVPGDDFVPGVDHSNKGPVQVPDINAGGYQVPFTDGTLERW
jgi:hypothetical protein